MKCCLCDKVFNANREVIFSGKPPICNACGKSLVENLFASTEFNEYLDSFLQSRISKHVPSYDEYYTRYHKKKCPDCNGTGMIEGKVCHRCNWIGTIEE